MKSKFKRTLLMGIFSVAMMLTTAAIADEAKKNNPLTSCPQFHGVYKPLSAYKASYLSYKQNPLDFTLTIASHPGWNHTVGPYFIFDAHDRATRKKVSTMRLGWGCGGTSHYTCGLSSYIGQYALEENAKEFERGVGLNVFGLDKNMSETWPIGNGEQIPYLLVFQGTAKLFEDVKAHPKDWNKYIKFYTKDKLLPDFSRYDVWILSECKEGAGFFQRNDTDILEYKENGSSK